MTEEMHAETMTVGEAIALLEEARQRIDDLVRAKRRFGMPWEEIGAEYGVSRQAAWERFRHVDEEKP